MMFFMGENGTMLEVARQKVEKIYAAIKSRLPFVPVVDFVRAFFD
jgi:hypothetical protein